VALAFAARSGLCRTASGLEKCCLFADYHPHKQRFSSRLSLPGAYATAAKANATHPLLHSRHGRDWKGLPAHSLGMTGLHYMCIFLL